VSKLGYWPQIRDFRDVDRVLAPHKSEMRKSTRARGAAPLPTPRSLRIRSWSSGCWASRAVSSSACPVAASVGRSSHRFWRAGKRRTGAEGWSGSRLVV